MALHHSYCLQFNSIRILAEGEDCNLRGIIDLQFVEDIADLIFHGLLTQIEYIGDCLVWCSEATHYIVVIL